jgi:hypothetical protein
MKALLQTVTLVLIIACGSENPDPDIDNGKEPVSHASMLQATPVTASTIELTWQDAQDAGHYLILAKTGSGQFPVVSDGIQITNDSDWTDNRISINVAQGNEKTTISNLAESTPYDFIIYAYNVGGDPSPNYKTDGNVPEASTTTLSNSGDGFGQSLLSISAIDVSGSPFDITSDLIGYMAHPQQYINWSYIPRIVMVPRLDGSYAVAWFDEDNNVIKITEMNGDDTRNGDDISVGSGVHAIGGFDLMGTNYVIGSVTGQSKEVYQLSIVGSDGSVGSTTDLTGTIGLEDLHSKQAPLDFGSARIKVNPTSEKISAFISHKMKWDDGVKHQGAMVKILDTSGNILGGDVLPYADDAAGGDGWFWSHNFDTRMIINSNEFVLVGNGDYDPRAIPVRIIDSSNGTYSENTSLFSISGDLGDNDTKTQLGGFVLLNDNSYALTFSSEEGKTARNVMFMHLSSAGQEISSKWLTSYDSKDTGYAINVKSATYGGNILVAWEEVTDNVSASYKSKFAVIDKNGEFIEAPTEFVGVRFNRGDDFINFSNGDIGWAIGSGQQIKIYRLKL